MSRHGREPYFWSKTMIISVLLFFVATGWYWHTEIADLFQSAPQPGPVVTAPYRPVVSPIPQRPAQPHPAPTPTYTVKEGDSLWKIAETLFSSSTTTGSRSSPSKPTKPVSSSMASPVHAHSASGNLTLFRLVQRIEQLNPQIKNPNLIFPGQILKL